MSRTRRVTFLHCYFVLGILCLEIPTCKAFQTVTPFVVRHDHHRIGFQNDYRTNEHSMSFKTTNRESQRRNAFLEDAAYMDLYDSMIPSSNGVGGVGGEVGARSSSGLGTTSTSSSGSKGVNGRPFPVMPSPTFLSLVKSQLELLANSLGGGKKVKSMALYLPQENSNTGQLEFVPAAVFPCPTTERIFIANDAETKMAPQIPKTLTKLPGFANAQSLIPAYPFTTASPTNTTTVEEVPIINNHHQNHHNTTTSTFLSSPLLSGSRTSGVLLVWPNNNQNNKWTKEDKMQVSLAVNSLTLALSMDQEKWLAQMHTQEYAVALADNLHQLKNPLQAMRTFAKLVQRKVVMDLNNNNNNDNTNNHLHNSTTMSSSMPHYAQSSSSPQLVALAENMILQSERVLDLLRPMDSIVHSMEQQQQQQKLLLGSSSMENKGQYILAPSKTADNNNNNNNNKNSNLILLSPKKKQLNKITTKRNLKKSSSRNNKNPTIKSSSSNMIPTISPEKKRTKPKNSNDNDSTTNMYVKRSVDLQMSFIQDILEPILSSFQILALEKNIQWLVYGLDNYDLPGVTVCPKGLQEALSNLLDNAIKYVTLKTDNDQSPCIKVIIARNAQPFEPGVTIWIHDNGPGIPQNERESVFQRGHRGTNTKSISEGSGIGLDISKTLLESMGGSLTIVDNIVISNYLDESSFNGGTTMQLVLYRTVDRNSI